MIEHLGKVLTIEELAAYLKISKSSLYKLAQKDEIPGQKVSKYWRFRRDIIDQWLAEGTPAGKRKDEG